MCYFNNNVKYDYNISYVKIFLVGFDEYGFYVIEMIIIIENEFCINRKMLRFF